MKQQHQIRRLIVVTGDQLNACSSAFDEASKECDVIWMAEAAAESEKVRSNKLRIAYFLSSMRHFRDALRKKGWVCHYRELEENSSGTLGGALADDLQELSPQEVILAEPGEWSVEEQLRQVLRDSGIKWEIREDRHFLCSRREFQQYARGRKQLRMEFFYREMRRRYDVLMDGDRPLGGRWNYDTENRGSFSPVGPMDPSSCPVFKPDALTRSVIELVEDHFPDHPGSLKNFNWPVTPAQARKALDAFIQFRLPNFGRYQDAMWMDRPFLYHSLLSAALNVKLLHPMTVIEAVEEAYRQNRVSIESAEGFIRQVLGWREYIRGIYWLKMPGYAEQNALGARHDLPPFYWTGETDMICLQQAIGQTLEHGYAHHIQRLMVTGLYALLFGVHPNTLHAWYLAVYVDAVEWVELPNTIGMSQYADGGLLASKPYIATGNYIKRMSNYCKSCRYNPGKRLGPDACPFTTLYWDFVQRHEALIRSNPRTALQARNLDRLSVEERKAVQLQARTHREEVSP